MFHKQEKYVCNLNINPMQVLVTVIVINVYYVNGFAEKFDDVIYMLLWSGGHFAIEDMPFSVMRNGRSAFIQRNCTYNNCYMTDDTSYFNDILKFDVILFNVLYTKFDLELPHTRSENQKYVLVGLEPAGLHQVHEKMNKFFNITWTYKLDSDVVFPYIVIKNERNEIVGPRRDMHWIGIRDMNETSLYIKNKLQKKRIAAAWFASNCEAPNGRLEFVRLLHIELEKYDQRVDTYGMCGNMCCLGDECAALIESTYYFYLAFENSFSEDYVSEKILTALEHFVVPVVFGGANYTRFMPDGIYLDARALGPTKLAKEMIDIMYNKTRYYEFFKWHGYYSFHYTGENNFHYEICGLCALLNNKTRMNEKKNYRTNFWWNEWYNGIPHTTEGLMRLLIDDDNKPAGIAGLVSNIYNYFFDK